jgi:hypothetical protein
MQSRPLANADSNAAATSSGVPDTSTTFAS